MKRIAFLLLLVSLAIPTFTAQAHPADMYAHTVAIAVTPGGLRINWAIKPGPVLTGFLWYEMDTDQDGTLSPREIEAWSRLRAARMTASLDDKPLPLVVESIELPGSLRAFQAGEKFITFDLSARWEPGAGNVQRFVIENGWEPQKSINWYYLTAEDDAAFLFPSQRSHILAVDMIRDRNLLPDQSPLLTAWDSGMPALPLGQQKDAVTETAEQIVPELAEQTSQDILLDLVRTREFSFAFYLIALLIALALGALHALTPGHGKTVVAAYLVGARGTSLHAVALGTVVTLTHTGSVLLLGIVTLAASQYILPTAIVPFLEILSGVLIVGLGLYLLWQRLVFWQKSCRKIALRFEDGGGSMTAKRISFAPAAPRKPAGAVKIQTPAAGMHHHGGGNMHSHEIPQHITWRSLIALGVSGGLVPCPDAIAILLVAIAINRVVLGLMLILSFSLGLAVVLIVIGLLMVNSRKLFDRFGFLDRLAPVMPLVSAVIVLALGFGLTWGAVVRAQDQARAAAPVLRSVEEARVVYLSEDQTRVKHLFITDYSRGASRLLAQDVLEYDLAPGQDVIAYVILTGERGHEIWRMDLVTMERNMILDCAEAICSGLVWSPGGDRLIYERLNLADSPSGLPTLWWIDLETGEDQPVFQEAQLPGGNPRWSPDGGWLSYAAPEGIRLYHLKNGETRLIPNILGAAALWSPDGKRILLRDVVIRRGQFLTQMFLYDLASGRLTNVTPEEGMENLLAAWSPDGEWIAVVRRDLAVPRGDQIWLMRADGSDARMITNDPDALHGSLNWSPDGRYLLYDLYALDVFPSVSRVRVMDLETGEVRDLGANGFNPKWAW